MSSVENERTTVALMMVDIVNSTGHQRELVLSEAYRRGVYEPFYALLDEVVGRFKQARVCDKTGDGCLVMLGSSRDAVMAALWLHELLRQRSWPTKEPVQARIGIAPAEPIEVEDGRLVSGRIPVCSRIMGLAKGGQTLLNEAAFDLVRERVAEGPRRQDGSKSVLIWKLWGPYELQGEEKPVVVGEVGVVGLHEFVAPAATDKARPVGQKAPTWRPGLEREVMANPGWILKKKLGCGGFGEAWVAEKPGAAPQVFKFCFDPLRLRSFERERSAFDRIRIKLGQRADIVRLLDHQLDSEPYLLATEFVEGGNLEVWAEKHGGLATIPLATRLQLLIQVARATHAAHDLGIIHRDLKPANIFMQVLPDGGLQAKVGDFGIARIEPDATDLKQPTLPTESVSGASVSTPGTRLYQPPENYFGQPGTAQADVYALGVLLYQMVVGSFREAVGEGWADKVEDELLRADVRASIHGDTQHRLQSAAELADRLERLDERRAELAVQRRAEAERAELERLAAARGRRARRAQVAAVMLALGMVALGSVAWSAWKSFEDERARAEAATAELARADRIWEGAVAANSAAAALLEPGSENVIAARLREVQVQLANVMQQNETLPEDVLKLPKFDEVIRRAERLSPQIGNRLQQREQLEQRAAERQQRQDNYLALVGRPGDAEGGEYDQAVFYSPVGPSELLGQIEIREFRGKARQAAEAGLARLGLTTEALAKAEWARRWEDTLRLYTADRQNQPAGGEEEVVPDERLAGKEHPVARDLRKMALELLLVRAACAAREPGRPLTRGERAEAGVWLAAAREVGNAPDRANWARAVDQMERRLGRQGAADRSDAPAALGATAMECILLGVAAFEQIAARGTTPGPGAYDEPLRHFARAVELEPGHLWARYYLAICLRTAQRSNEALAHASACRGLRENRLTRLLQGLAQCDVALPAEAGRQCDEAIDGLLREFEAERPVRYALLLARAESRLKPAGAGALPGQLPRNLAGAIADAEAAGTLFAGDRAAAIVRAKAYTSQAMQPDATAGQRRAAIAAIGPALPAAAGPLDSIAIELLLKRVELRRALAASSPGASLPQDKQQALDEIKAVIVALEQSGVDRTRLANAYFKKGELLRAFRPPDDTETDLKEEQEAFGSALQSDQAHQAALKGWFEAFEARHQRTWKTTWPDLYKNEVRELAQQVATRYWLGLFQLHGQVAAEHPVLRPAPSGASPDTPRAPDYVGAITSFGQALELLTEPGEAAGLRDEAAEARQAVRSSLYAHRGWAFLLTDSLRLAQLDFAQAAELSAENADARLGQALTAARLLRGTDRGGHSPAASRLLPDGARVVQGHLQAANAAWQKADAAGPLLFRPSGQRFRYVEALVYAALHERDANLTVQVNRGASRRVLDLAIEKVRQALAATESGERRDAFLKEVVLRDPQLWRVRETVQWGQAFPMARGGGSAASAGRGAAAGPTGN